MMLPCYHNVCDLMHFIRSEGQIDILILARSHEDIGCTMLKYTWTLSHWSKVLWLISIPRGKIANQRGGCFDGGWDK